MAVLPDHAQRNDLKFAVLRSVPYNVRIWLIVGLWACGLLIQALGFVWPGAAVILAGTVMALTRGYSNEPARVRRGKRQWENVTLEQFGRISTLDEESRRWDRSAWIDATNALGGMLGVVIVAAIVGASFLLAQTSVQLASVCLIDGAVLFVPFWVTGIRRLYHRTELMIRVRALHNILVRLGERDARGLMATPMLELEETKRGKLPHDVKLMVRFDDASDDFMGIQVQVSLNNVQGTKYPYLYCVILAKPGFGLHGWNTELDRSRPKIIVERNMTEEVELLVVRQKTTRKSGYHTKEPAQRRVFEAAVGIARRNLPRHGERLEAGEN